MDPKVSSVGLVGNKKENAEKKENKKDMDCMCFTR